MTLFLKNLPKSFFRAVVSSRPIFNKADSLFSSIAINAQPKLPVLAVGRSHAKSICFGNSLEGKRKYFLNKYNIFNDRAYSKKVKKSTKPSQSNKISSGAVSCINKKGDVQCSVDCEQLSAGKEVKEQEKDDQCKTSEIKEDDTKPRKKFIPKYQKEEKETSRRDVQAITGTWVSKKCMKFNFSACPQRKSDPSTQPVKLEDQKSSKAYSVCNKASSKELARKASQKQATVHKTDACSKPDEKKEAQPKKNEDSCMRRVKSHKEEPHSKDDVCKSTKKLPPKDKNETKTPPEKSAKNKGKKGEEDKSCKPCTSKKTDKKKNVSSKKKVPPRLTYKPKKQKSEVTKKCSSKSKKTCSQPKENRDIEVETAANSALVVSNCAKTDTSDMDEKCIELIAKLKKELEECRTTRMKEVGMKDMVKSEIEKTMKECVEAPKLDASLPKIKEQEKDVVSGSKNFVKSVCDGMFSKSSTQEKVTKKVSKKPGKSKSAPVVKTAKKGKNIKKIKSANCEIDLDPQYCHKPKKDNKKKEAKKSEEDSKENDGKKSSDLCKKKEEIKEVKKSYSDMCSKKGEAKEAKKSSKLEKKKESKKSKMPEAPCRYEAPKILTTKEVKMSSIDICKKEEKKEAKKSSTDICKNEKEKKEAKKSSSDICQKKHEKKEAKKSSSDICKKKEHKKEAKKSSSNVCTKKDEKKEAKKSSSDICKKKGDKKEATKSSSEIYKTKKEKKEAKKSSSDICKKKEDKKVAKKSSGDICKKKEEKKGAKKSSTDICNKEKEKKAVKKKPSSDICMKKDEKTEAKKSPSHICKKKEEKKEAKKSSSDICKKKEDTNEENKSSGDICKKRKEKKEAKKFASDICKKDEKKEVKKSSSDICTKKDETKEAKKSSSDICKKQDQKKITSKQVEKKKKVKAAKLPKAPCTYEAPKPIKLSEERKQDATSKPTDDCEALEADKEKRDEVKAICSKVKRESKPNIEKRKKSKSDVKCSQESVKTTKKKKKKKKKSTCSQESKTEKEKKKSEGIAACICDEEKKVEEKSKDQKKGAQKKKEDKIDQTPLMQCVNICKKKMNDDGLKLAKKVRSEPKKECTTEHRIYKKMSDIDKQPKASTKEVKKFIPSKHEEIKSGLRGNEARKDQCKENKSEEEVVPSKHENVVKQDHGDSGECEEEAETTVQKGTCPKFALSCSKDKKEETEKCEEEKDACECSEKSKDNSPGMEKPVNKKNVEVVAALKKKPEERQCDTKKANKQDKKSFSSMSCSQFIKGDKKTDEKKTKSETHIAKKRLNSSKKADEKQNDATDCKTKYASPNLCKTTADRKTKDDTKEAKDKNKHHAISKEKANVASEDFRPTKQDKIMRYRTFIKLSSSEKKLKELSQNEHSGVSSKYKDIRHSIPSIIRKVESKPNQRRNPCVEQKTAKEEKSKIELKATQSETLKYERKNYVLRLRSSKSVQGACEENKNKVTENADHEEVITVIEKRQPLKFENIENQKDVKSKPKENIQKKLPTKAIYRSKTGTKFTTSVHFGNGCSYRRSNIEMLKSPKIEKAAKKTKNSTTSKIEENRNEELVYEDLLTRHIIKQFVPACNERKSDANTKEMTKLFKLKPDKLKISALSYISSGQSENSRTCIRQKYTDSSEHIKENEEKKNFVPCEHEEIKPGIRKPEDQVAKKSPAHTSDDDLEYKDCEEDLEEEVKKCIEQIQKYSQSKTKKKNLNAAKTEKASSSKECGTETVVSCKYEDIKDAILQKITGSGHKKECKTRTTTEIVACQYEDIKDAILQKITRSRQKKERGATGKQVRACKYEDIKEEVLSKITGSGLKGKSDSTGSVNKEECETTIKQVVACNYEDIKEGILQKISGSSRKERAESCHQEKHEEKKFEGCETSEDTHKEVVACKYEDIKDAVLKKITGSVRKDGEQKQTEDTDICAKFDKEKEEEVKEECKESKDEIKIFKPCAHEVIKPGIRKTDGKKSICQKDDKSQKQEIKKYKASANTEVKNKETKKVLRGGTNKNIEVSKVPSKACPKFKNPCPDCHKKEEDIRKETQKEENKILKPCEHEETKPDIRKPNDEEQEEKSEHTTKERSEESHDSEKADICKEFSGSRFGIKVDPCKKKDEEALKTSKSEKKEVKDTCRKVSKKEDQDQSKSEHKEKEDEDLCKKFETKKEDQVKQDLIQVCAQDTGKDERGDFNLSESANTAIVVGTFDKYAVNTAVQKAQEIIERLKRDIKECRESSPQPTVPKVSEQKKEFEDVCKKVETKRETKKEDQNPCKKLEAKTEKKKEGQDRSKCTEKKKVQDSCKKADKKTGTKNESQDPCKKVGAKKETQKENQDSCKSTEKKNETKKEVQHPCKIAVKKTNTKREDEDLCQKFETKRETKKEGQDPCKKVEPKEESKKKDQASCKTTEKKKEVQDPCKKRAEKTEPKKEDEDLCKKFETKREMKKESRDPCKKAEKKKETKDQDSCKKLETKKETKKEDHDPCICTDKKKEMKKEDQGSCKKSETKKETKKVVQDPCKKLEPKKAMKKEHQDPSKSIDKKKDNKPTKEVKQNVIQVCPQSIGSEQKRDFNLSEAANTALIIGSYGTKQICQYESKQTCHRAREIAELRNNIKECKDSLRKPSLPKVSKQKKVDQHSCKKALAKETLSEKDINKKRSKAALKKTRSDTAAQASKKDMSSDSRNPCKCEDMIKPSSKKSQSRMKQENIAKKVETKTETKKEDHDPCICIDEKKETKIEKQDPCKKLAKKNEAKKGKEDLAPEQKKFVAKESFLTRIYNAIFGTKKQTPPKKTLSEKQIKKSSSIALKKTSSDVAKKCSQKSLKKEKSSDSMKSCKCNDMTKTSSKKGKSEMVCESDKITALVQNCLKQQEKNGKYSETEDQKSKKDLRSKSEDKITAIIENCQRQGVKRRSKGHNKHEASLTKHLPSGKYTESQREKSTKTSSGTFLTTCPGQQKRECSSKDLKPLVDCPKSKSSSNVSKQKGKPKKGAKSDCHIDLNPKHCAKSEKKGKEDTKVDYKKGAELQQKKGKIKEWIRPRAPCKYAEPKFEPKAVKKANSCVDIKPTCDTEKNESKRTQKDDVCKTSEASTLEEQKEETKTPKRQTEEESVCKDPNEEKEDSKEQDPCACSPKTSRFKPLVSSPDTSKPAEDAKYASYMKEDCPEKMKHMVTCSEGNKTCKHKDKRSLVCGDSKVKKPAKKAKPLSNPKAAKKIKNTQSSPSKSSLMTKLLKKEKKEPKEDKPQAKKQVEPSNNKKTDLKTISPDDVQPEARSCREPRDTEEHSTGTSIVEKLKSKEPDQSPLMKTIALCKLKKQTKTTQKGKVPPRDKKCYCEDQGAKSLVKFYEGKKPEKKDSCERIELVQEKLCPTGPDEVQKVPEKICREKNAQKSTAEKVRKESQPVEAKKDVEKKVERADSVQNKEEVGCMKLKVKVFEDSDEKEKCDISKEEEKEKIKIFVPCQHEEIKSGIRGQHLNTASTVEEMKKVEEKSEIKAFVPCMYEDTKPGIRHDYNTEETHDEKCEDPKEKIKMLAPCEHEGVKPGICYEHKEDKQETKTGKKEDPKDVSACRHDNIKDEVLKKIMECEKDKTETVKIKSSHELKKPCAEIKEKHEEEGSKKELINVCQKEEKDLEAKKTCPKFKNTCFDVKAKEEKCEKEDEGDVFEDCKDEIKTSPPCENVETKSKTSKDHQAKRKDDPCKQKDDKKDEDSEIKDSEDSCKRGKLNYSLRSFDHDKIQRYGTRADPCKKKEDKKSDADKCHSKNEDSKGKKGGPKLGNVCLALAMKSATESNPCTQKEEEKKKSEDTCEKQEKSELLAEKQCTDAVQEINKCPKFKFICKSLEDKYECKEEKSERCEMKENSCAKINVEEKEQQIECKFERFGVREDPCEKVKEKKVEKDEKAKEVKQCKNETHQEEKFERFGVMEDPCEKAKEKKAEDETDSCTKKKDEKAREVKQDFVLSCKTQREETSARFAIKEDSCKKGEDKKDSCSQKKGEKVMGVKQDKTQTEEKFERFGVKEDPCKLAKEKKSEDTKDSCSQKTDEKTKEVKHDKSKTLNEEKFEKFGIKEDPCKLAKEKKSEDKKDSCFQKKVEKIKEVEKDKSKTFGVKEEDWKKREDYTKEDISAPFTSNVDKTKTHDNEDVLAYTLCYPTKETKPNDHKTIGSSQKTDNEYMQARSLYFKTDTSSEKKDHKDKIEKKESVQKQEERGVQAYSLVIEMGSSSKKEEMKEDKIEYQPQPLQAEHEPKGDPCNAKSGAKCPEFQCVCPSACDKKEDPCEEKKAEVDTCKEEKKSNVQNFERFGVKENPCNKLPEKKKEKEDSCEEEKPVDKDKRPSFPERKNEEKMDFERFGVKEDICKKDACEEEKSQKVKEDPCEYQAKTIESTDKEMKDVECGKKKPEKVKEDPYECVKKQDRDNNTEKQQCAPKQFHRYGVKEDPCEKVNERQQREQEQKTSEKVVQEGKKEEEKCTDKLTEKGKQLCRIYKHFLEQNPKTMDDRDKR